MCTKEELELWQPYVTAHLENGILRLEIPKAEEVKPRKRSIQAGKQPEMMGEKTREVGK